MSNSSDLPSKSNTEQFPTPQYFSHCLRPIRTSDFLNKVLMGTSLNLYGVDDVGKRRLLEEVKTFCEENYQDIKIISLSMSSYQNDYQGLIDDIKNQLDISQPDITFQELVGGYLKGKPDKKLFFFLDRFDRIFTHHIAPEYNKIFYSYLNSLCNNKKVVLVLATEKIYSTYQAFVEKQPIGSILSLEDFAWEGISYNDILNEFARRDDIKAYFEQKPNHKNLFINAVQRHPTPNTFQKKLMEEMEVKINELSAMDELKIEGQLQVWRKKLQKQQTPELDKWLRELEEWINRVFFRTDRLLKIGFRIRNFFIFSGIGGCIYWGYQIILRLFPQLEIWVNWFNN